MLQLLLARAEQKDRNITRIFKYEFQATETHVQSIFSALQEQYGGVFSIEIYPHPLYVVGTGIIHITVLQEPAFDPISPFYFAEIFSPNYSIWWQLPLTEESAMYWPRHKWEQFHRQKYPEGIESLWETARPAEELLLQSIAS